jgi:hypothetical protein
MEDFEVLSGHETPDAINRLLKVYNKDPYNARVVYHNNDKDSYSYAKVILFKINKYDYDIVCFKISYGISKTNKIYRSEKRVYTIRFRRKSGFWYCGGYIKIRPLTFNDLMGIKVIKDFFTEKYAWVRYVLDSGIRCSQQLNYYRRHKLYSAKKQIINLYGLPYPASKKLHEIGETSFPFLSHNPLESIKYYKEYLINIENINLEWLGDRDKFSLFYDTLKMARQLDKKVNCSWSFKRLKREHDNYARVITDICYIYDNRELKISEIYKDFAEFSGYKLATQTKELAYIGKKLNHCVATYANNVDNGNCAIFDFDEYTLEIRQHWTNGRKELYVGQFRGFSNCNAPYKLEMEVREMLKDFNSTLNEGEEILVEDTNPENLPF